MQPKTANVDTVQVSTPPPGAPRFRVAWAAVPARDGGDSTKRNIEANTVDVAPVDIPSFITEACSHTDV